MTQRPTPDADLEERRRLAARDMPASLHRLDHLADPVSRVVLDLHRREQYLGDWACALCLEGNDMGDPQLWPCDTVQAVADVHGIDLADFWLLRRPVDGSLDQPQGDQA